MISRATHPLVKLDASVMADGASYPGCALVKRRVLFAIRGAAHPYLSLWRASRIAELLEADLHLLQVLPKLMQSAPLFRKRSGASESMSIDCALTAMRTTSVWLNEVLGDGFPHERLAVRTGSFAQQVAEYAAELQAELIIMPPGKHDFGAMVSVLASASGLPVLVMREPRSINAIVAATDLEDPSYPVLRGAADFGDQIQVSVIPFHNVTPGSAVVRADATWPPVTFVPGAAETEARGLRLARAARFLHIEARGLLATEASPVDAILHAARVTDADMVVVGARPRSWLNSWVARSVAAHVVNRSRRSVLVLPIAASAPPRTVSTVYA